MDTLTWLFLESSTALLALLGLVIFGLVAYWRRGGSVKAPLAGLLVGLLLLLVQEWIVTPREVVDKLMREIERDVVASRTERIAAALAPQFRADDMDGERFLALVKRRFEQFDVHGVNRESFVVTPAGPDELKLEAEYGATVSSNAYNGPFPTGWVIRFRHGEAGWRISSIEPTSLVHRPIGGWSALR